jgi:hypothetical protein
MPFTYQSHVSAAKAGVDQLMRTLALEWGPLGIRANSIVPGPVAGTEGMRRLAETAGAETWESMVPLGRFAFPEEIGRMAAVLISPIASFMNGSQVVVDGRMAQSGPSAFNDAVLRAAGGSRGPADGCQSPGSANAARPATLTPSRGCSRRAAVVRRQ